MDPCVKEFSDKIGSITGSIMSKIDILDNLKVDYDDDETEIGKIRMDIDRLMRDKREQDLEDVIR